MKFISVNFLRIFNLPTRPILTIDIQNWNNINLTYHQKQENKLENHNFLHLCKQKIFFVNKDTLVGQLMLYVSPVLPVAVFWNFF